MSTKIITGFRNRVTFELIIHKEKGAAVRRVMEGAGFEIKVERVPGSDDYYKVTTFCMVYRIGQLRNLLVGVLPYKDLR